MRLRFRTALLLILAACVPVAGCGERSPTEPEPAATLGFTYSGERSGTYQVQGDVPLNGEGRPRHGTWAAALQIPGSDLGITAARAAAAPLADVFVIALHNITAPGTYPLDGSCNHATPTACALGMLAFGYSWNSSDPAPDPYYLLTSGSITIAAMDAARVRGTFQVRGVRQPSGTGTISLANGSFDVPIVQALSVRQNLLPLWGALEQVRSSDPRMSPRSGHQSGRSDRIRIAP